MILYDGRLDYTQHWETPHIFMFTGNPVKKNNGAIVMGAGAAKQVRDTYIGIDKKLGDQVTPQSLIIWANIAPNRLIGWFKVKHHWRDTANMDLIRASAQELAKIAASRPDLQFHMNYPGIGNGKLIRQQVEPLLQVLPDNVHIYI